MEHDYVIYGLYCPLSEQYRYIGKSKNGLRRAYGHFTRSHSTDVMKWVLDIKGKGYTPEVHLITTCDSQEEMDYEEIVCINLYREEGHNLLNKVVYSGHAEELNLLQRQNKLLRDKLAIYKEIDLYISKILECKNKLDEIDGQ